MNVGGTHSSIKAIPGANLKSLALCVSIKIFHILATSPLLVKLFQGMSLGGKNTDLFWAEIFRKKSIMRQICLHLQLKRVVVTLQWDVSGCLCSSAVANFAYLERRALTGAWEMWFGSQLCTKLPCVDHV